MPQPSLENADIVVDHNKEGTSNEAVAEDGTDEAEIRGDGHEILLQKLKDRVNGFESHQLLEILAISYTEIVKNLSNMLRLGRVADPSDHNRSNLLIRSLRFQNWLFSTSPIFLLVDGKGGSAAERISAMTFVSALLAQTLSEAGTSCITIFADCIQEGVTT